MLQSLFEQLWAADDYEIFKRMMMQKNLELQLQALDLLAHQYGLLPESFLPQDDYEPSAEEKKIMETVVRWERIMLVVQDNNVTYSNCSILLNFV